MIEPSRQRRMLIFCVSEMSPYLVSRWSPDLPNLSRLIREGVYSRTRYSVPYYLTPQMWATINTGMTAGHHGLYDYRQRGSDGVFRETSGADVAAQSWWQYLEAAGLSAGIVNLPMTFPPSARSGFMISGQDAPGDHPSIMAPESLWHEMRSQFGRYHLKDIFPGGQDRRSYAKILKDEVARQADVYCWLAARNEWDCLALYTSAVAMAQHYYWDTIDGDGDSPLADTVRSVFIDVDRMLGRIIETLGDDLNVFVISECGAGLLASGVNLNAVLCKAGFLTFGSGRAAGRRKIEARTLTWVRTKAQRYLPKSLFYAANRSPLRHWVLGRLANNRIDWSRTRAYHRGKGEGNIYFNLRGRERGGIVALHEVSALTQAITTALLALRTPEGDQPVVAVHRRDDLYSGPKLEAAPDLVIEWKDAAFMPTEREQATDADFGDRWREYMSWPTSGSHRPEGVFIAAGPDIAARDDMVPISLVDLAPLWLRMAGVTPPTSMDGQVRSDFPSPNAPASAQHAELPIES